MVTAVAFVFFAFGLFNFDLTFPIIYSVITYGMTSPTIGIGEFILKKGNHFVNPIMKVVYYALMVPAIIFIIFLVMYYLLYYSGMGLAILFILAGIVASLVAPYLQALFALFFRNFVRQK